MVVSDSLVVTDREQAVKDVEELVAGDQEAEAAEYVQFYREKTGDLRPFPRLSRRPRRLSA